MLVPFDDTLVTARLSVSPPVSFVNTPLAALTDNVWFSVAVAVSAEPTGPTPVTVMTKSAVSVVPAPSLTVYVNVSVAVAPCANPSAPAVFATYE